jgi:hypothetical protein
LAFEKCLVLFDADAGEALEELRHCHILEFDSLHGLRTRNGREALDELVCAHTLQFAPPHSSEISNLER